MNLRRLLALVRKEYFQIIRDPSSILIAVVLPVLLIFIFAYAVSMDVNEIRIGVVLEDSSPEAQSLARSFMNTKYFSVSTAHDRRVFERDLMAGHLRGVVVIPQNFAKLLNTDTKGAPLQVITDGSEPNTANFVENYSKGVWQIWLAQRHDTEGINLMVPLRMETRIWYNPEIESRNFLLPGALALIMTLIGTLLTALVISREWERGTMEALLSTSITRGELILGKLIPYFALGMLSLFLSFLSIVFLFSVPFRGSAFLFFGVGAVFLLTALGLGLLISTTARNQFVACQLAFLLAFMPSLMLSGFIFEINSMPAAIRLLCHVIPAKYFISCLQSLFLVGTIPAILLPNVLLMLLMSLVFFILTYRKTRKKIE